MMTWLYTRVWLHLLAQPPARQYPVCKAAALLARAAAAERVAGQPVAVSCRLLLRGLCY
jgi:hypothetical protein